MRQTSANRILGLLLLFSLAGGLLLSLLNPATVRVSGYGAVHSGEWMERYQAEYEDQLPLGDLALNVWTALRYVLFREGQSGLLIGDNNWLFSEEEFSYHPDGPQRIEANLAFVLQTRQRLQQRGIDLVIALVPAKARIYPHRLGRYRFPDYAEVRYDQFRAALLEHRIAAPDLAAALTVAMAHGEVFLRSDTHWTPHGAHAAAAALAVTADPLLEQRGSARARFRLDAQPPLEHSGDLLNFLPLGPFADRLGPEPDRVRQFRAQQVEAADIGLFDDVSIPVTLIGTSYSAGEVWNFEAFLKRELRADVLNLAQQGRGPFAPMRDYLDSPTIEDVPPDLVIWEIPERYLVSADFSAN